MSCTADEHSSYEELLLAWHDLGGERIRVERLPCANRTGHLLFARIGDSDRPVISMTAGMHGDEPAALWALLHLVREGRLDSRFAYVLWPCVNPDGYRAGRRLSADNADINRSFDDLGTTAEAQTMLHTCRGDRYLLQIDMHEDVEQEAEGFYCYEPVSQPGGRLGVEIIAAMVRAGFSLQRMHDTFDVTYDRQTLTLSDGHILYDPWTSGRKLGGTMYNDALVRRRAAGRVITFETPGREAWRDRLAMQAIAVTGVIAQIVLPHLDLAS